LKYEEPLEYEFEKISELLESNNDSDLINGLLSLVLKSGNYDLSMEKSIEFSYSESEWIKGCGIECFGHIARLHKKIELDSVTQILASGLKSKSRIIAGKSESAIEDIAHFLELDRKIFQ